MPRVGFEFGEERTRERVADDGQPRHTEPVDLVPQVGGIEAVLGEHDDRGAHREHAVGVGQRSGVHQRAGFQNHRNIATRS